MVCNIKIKAVRRPPSKESLISAMYNMKSSSFADVINKVIEKEINCSWLNTIVYINLSSPK